MQQSVASTELISPLPTAAARMNEFLHLPYDLLSLNIDWGTGRPFAAKAVYAPHGALLRIARFPVAVLRHGVPCVAFIFLGADETCRLLTSRRLTRLVVDFSQHAESLCQHEELNRGRDGAVVITASWSERDGLERLLLATLDQDQALQRMILRASMEDERIQLDATVLETFLREGGQVSRHFTGPLLKRYRLTNFRLLDRVFLGVGTHFELQFDDYEIMDFALERFRTFLHRCSETQRPCHLRLVGKRAKTTEDTNTDMLWSDMSFTLAAGLNRPALRMQAFDYLKMVCGLDGVRLPLAESLLSDLASGQGFPMTLF